MTDRLAVAVTQHNTTPRTPVEKNHIFNKTSNLEVDQHLKEKEKKKKERKMKRKKERRKERRKEGKEERRDGRKGKARK